MGWSYADSLSYLDDHVNLEAIGMGRKTAPTLDRMRQLAALMGDPQHTYPVIHLTGTNGKGSTARMITALLVERGLSVGTYTSPDLERVNERLAWNGLPIDDDDFAQVVGAVALLEALMDAPPNRFEILTAAAYRWFADVACDVVVAEVGLGGRWDATNVADGEVAVITNVSLDHAEVLGPSLISIAEEKSGIVKPGSTLVQGETDPSLAAVLRSAGAAAGVREVWERNAQFACTVNELAHGGRLLTLLTPATTYEDVFLPVHGAHQGDNAAAAVAAVEAFFGRPLPEDAVAGALGSVEVPGRMEVLSHRPLVVIDGAHNPAGCRAAAATLAEEFDAVGRHVLYVIGMLRERDPVEMLTALGTTAPATRLLVACPPPSPRALPPADVAGAAARLGVEAEVVGSVAAAVRRALDVAEEDDVVFVAGSLYVVGAARGVLRELLG